MTTDRDHVVEAYATAASRRDKNSLIGPALRTRSRAVRDVLARLAGAESCDSLTALYAAGDEAAAVATTQQQRRWLAALGRVVAAQNLMPDDRRLGRRLLEAVTDADGPGGLDADEQTIYAQLLFFDGDLDRLRAVLPSLGALPDVVAHYLRCDLVNPAVGASGAESDWLALVNEPFDTAGLEAISLDGSAATAFDGLGTEPIAGTVSGPLVSVIMTVFQPDASLVTAVRSVLDQSWADLELVMVDDASGSEYDELLHHCLALDSRVSLVRQHVNGGTYLARNAGLDLARGEYVAFQDSDDWSHPRRIERQVAVLREDHGLVASRSRIVRAHPDLTHQWLGYPAQRLNPWSLIIRREPVIDTVGYFDTVRKGADSEYAARLLAAFGKRIHDLDEPLAYYRLHPTSLSRSDFSHGWSAPTRIAYQAAFVEWHREITSGESPHRSADPGERPFPAPASFLDRVPGAPGSRQRYDVVLLDDWQPRNGPHDVALDELAALTSRGTAVGVAQLEAAGLMVATRKLPARQIQEAINTGAIDRVLLDQEVAVGTLVVRNPAVLQFPPEASSRLRVDRVIIMARRPSEYGELAPAYDAATCTETARAMFGVEPVWAVGHGGLASAYGVELVVPSPVEVSWVDERRPRGPRPVVGRFGDRGDDDLPSARSMRLVPADSRVLWARGTRYLGRQVRRVARKAANPGLEVKYRGKQSWGEHLSSVDFLLCYPHDPLAVTPLDVIVRAMAAGVVVVVPAEYGDLLGDAVVYAPREAVRDTVRRLHHDTDEYRRQAERAGHWVWRHHSFAAYASAIQQLVASQTGGEVP